MFAFVSSETAAANGPELDGCSITSAISALSDPCCLESISGQSHRRWCGWDSCSVVSDAMGG